MSTQNDTVEINKILIDGLKQNMYEEIKRNLLEGKEYKIPGVGVIKAHSRRVKSQNGDNNFAVILKIKQDKDFGKEIRRSYKLNPKNFIG